MKKWMFIGVISLVVLCCGLSVIGAIVSPQSDQTTASIRPTSVSSTSGNNSEPNVSPTPESSPTPLPTAPAIEEIIKENEDMTDAQRNRYNEELANTRVENWTGTVIDVDEGEIFGGFTIYVDMVKNRPGAEVHIEVSEEVALAIRKDAEITFSGDIKSITDLFGATVFIENAVIETTE